jgi:hypothetical protein
MLTDNESLAKFANPSKERADGVIADRTRVLCVEA